MGENGHEAPPKPWSDCHEGAVPAEKGHLPSASARTQSGPAAAAALQQPWKALSGEVGKGASVLGKLTEQAFRQSDALSKGSHEPRFLPLLMPRGALESATVTTALICELMCEYHVSSLNLLRQNWTTGYRATDLLEVPGLDWEPSLSSWEKMWLIFYSIVQVVTPPTT